MYKDNYMVRPWYDYAGNVTYYSVLLFPKNEYSFQVAYYSQVFAFHGCGIGHRIVKLKLFHYIPISHN